MVGEPGLEPGYLESKSSVLPLDDSPARTVDDVVAEKSRALNGAVQVFLLFFRYPVIPAALVRGSTRCSALAIAGVMSGVCCIRQSFSGTNHADFSDVNQSVPSKLDAFRGRVNERSERSPRRLKYMSK